MNKLKILLCLLKKSDLKREGFKSRGKQLSLFVKVFKLKINKNVIEFKYFIKIRDRPSSVLGIKISVTSYYF